eukprot:9475415-Pyramimonas_sp.AAC.3
MHTRVTTMNLKSAGAFRAPSTTVARGERRYVGTNMVTVDRATSSTVGSFVTTPARAHVPLHPMMASSVPMATDEIMRFLSRIKVRGG